MSYLLVPGRLPGVLVLLGILLLPAGIVQDEEPPEWWRTQRDLTTLLIEGEARIDALVGEATGSSPEGAREAMFRVAVFLRAGMDAEAIAALHDLQRVWSKPSSHEIYQIYHHTTRKISAWSVARELVEVFASHMTGNGALDLPEHLLESGWNFRRVDEWLLDKPEGVDGFWFKARLLFHANHDRADPLLDELEKGVRENPSDVAGALAYLDALGLTRQKSRKERALAWMAEAIVTNLATEARELARRFESPGRWSTAAAFHRRNLEASLTDEEVRRLQTECAAFFPEPQVRAGFAVETRERLAKCLLELGQPDEAQKWMVEAADLREEHGLGQTPLFQGQVQAASGARVIEGRIRAEEKTSESDPRYWYRRADYYRGRDEADLEEKALVKALELTPLPPAEYRGGGQRGWWRKKAVGEYARFLRRHDRVDEALTLLREELRQAAMSPESAESAAGMLAFDLDKHITVGDPVLWDWLAHQPEWDHPEERLLWRMLEKASAGELDEYFGRAEALAREADPTRAHSLGWIMNRMDHPARSVPLLEYAARSAKDERTKHRFTFSLFDSYLDTGDWQGAERVLPAVVRRLTPDELPRWYVRLPLLAARAGARDDALRLWRGLASVHPTHLDGLADLAAAGLRDELFAFYREMAAEMPTSEVPARALGILSTE